MYTITQADIDEDTPLSRRHHQQVGVLHCDECFMPCRVAIAFLLEELEADWTVEHCVTLCLTCLEQATAVLARHS